MDSEDIEWSLRENCPHCIGSGWTVRSYYCLDCYGTGKRCSMHKMSVEQMKHMDGEARKKRRLANTPPWRIEWHDE